MHSCTGHVPSTKKKIKLISHGSPIKKYIYSNMQQDTCQTDAYA